MRNMSRTPPDSCLLLIALVFAIVLAEALGDLFSVGPIDRPFRGPGARVRQRIVDRHFIFQGVEVGSRKTLREAQRLRMRQPAVREPKARVVAARLDDQRVVFPMPGLMTEIS